MVSEGPGSHCSPPLCREATLGACKEPRSPRLSERATPGPKAGWLLPLGAHWGQSGSVPNAEQGHPVGSLARAA